MGILKRHSASQSKTSGKTRKITWIDSSDSEVDVPAKIEFGDYCARDVDVWMRSLGAKPISGRERTRLRKLGLLGMPEE